LLGRMKKEGIEVFAVNDVPDAIYVKVYTNVFNLEMFHQGLCEVHDISSQRVAMVADVHSGMRVADACAGNGGKTLHLGTLMKNRGKIVAMDVAQNKLDELRARCSRNGIDLVEVKKVTATDDLSSLNESFDRVLLDVPCTGTGVLRRNPDIRWRLYPEDVQEMMKEQKGILNHYSTLVKKGGELIYATCSIFPCEGEDQVREFVAAHSDLWQLEEEKRTNPIFEDGDGFYFAKLKRISG
jgi:16S rRNA (cytosine967-C5)-methyltransferase